MTYLLDTCIISKLRRLRKFPDELLENWLAKHHESSYFISALTIGEIQVGICKLDLDNKEDRHKRLILENWFLDEFIPRFTGRILAIDEEVSLLWGKISGENKQKGVILPLIDGFIAATAIAHNLTVVTENVRDFAKTGAKVFNPWLK